MGFSQQATWFDTLIKFLLLSIILLYYYNGWKRDSQPTSSTVENNLLYTIRFLHKREVNRLKTSSLKQTLEPNNHKNHLLNLWQSSTRHGLLYITPSLLNRGQSAAIRHRCFQVPKRYSFGTEINCSRPLLFSLLRIFRQSKAFSVPCPSHSPYCNSAHKHSRISWHLWLHCSLITQIRCSLGMDDRYRLTFHWLFVTLSRSDATVHWRTSNSQNPMN